MSSEIIIMKLEEVLTSTYFRSGDETVDAISQCDVLGEEFEIIEFSEKDFYLRILQHLRLFFNAEFMYLSKKVEKGLKSYQKLITAIGETLAEFPNLYSRWQYDIDRLVLRIDARIQDSKAQIAQTQENLVEADLLYTEAINRYNNELEFEQSNNDYDHYFNSLGNIFQATGFLYLLRGRKTNNRKDLYEALKNLKKAKFLGQPNLSSILEEIRNDTMSLILKNLEIQAEKFFNRGLLESEKERFTDAKISYQKSAQIFRSLKHIHPSIEYELQEQIQISSYYEAFAKSLMINDANEKASIIFSQANQTLQIVLQKISSDVLRQNFEPQMIYFQAMQLFCQAVTEYDKLIETAPTHFNEAKTMLEEAKTKAEELDNLPLTKNCQEILDKLRSYLEIADMMFQEEGLLQEDLNLTQATPEPIIETTPEPIVETTPEPIVETIPEPIVETTPEPIIETTPEPIVETTPEPIIETTPEPIVETTPEPIIETIPEPIVETTPEPIVETTPEPIVETIPEPIVETIPEPIVETTPEPIVETIPEPIIETTPEPIIETTPEPIVETIPEPIVETTPEPIIETIPEPIVETTPEPIVETIPEPIVETTPEPIVETTPEPIVETIPEPIVETTPEPIIETIPEPIVETIPEPIIETIPEPIIETIPEPIIETIPEPIVETTPEPIMEKEKEEKDIEIPELNIDKFESTEEE